MTTTRLPAWCISQVGWVNWKCEKQMQSSLNNPVVALVRPFAWERFQFHAVLKSVTGPYWPGCLVNSVTLVVPAGLMRLDCIELLFRTEFKDSWTGCVGANFKKNSVFQTLPCLILISSLLPWIQYSFCLLMGEIWFCRLYPSDIRLCDHYESDLLFGTVDLIF